MTADRPVVSPPEPPRSRFSRWVRVADVALGAALGAWCWVVFIGGFRFSIAGVRVSVSSRWRILLFGLIVAGIRYALAKPSSSASAAPDEGADLVQGTTGGAATRWRQVLACLLAVTAAWVMMTWPQVTGMGSLVGDPGDPYMKVWQLDWVAHALRGGWSHLYDANIFYPEPAVLAYTDAMIAPSIVAAPFIWAGVPPVVVFNVLMALGIVLSGVAMFGLVRYLTKNASAALVAGLAFAFLPYRFNHYSHLELQFTWGIPLAMWLFHLVCSSGKTRDGLLLGLTIGLQTLCSFYYGMFLGVFLLAVGPLLWRRAADRRASAKALLAGMAVTVICVLPAALPHVAAHASVGDRGIEDVRVFSATPANYLAPDMNNRLYNPEFARFGEHEKRLFPGFLLVALAIVGVWPPRSVRRVAYLVGVLVAFDASLGVNGHVFEALFELVPAIRGLRVPARFGILTGFALAVLAGYGVARIMGWLRWKPGRAAVVAALVAVMLFEYRSFPLPLFRIPATQPAVYAWLAAQPRTVVAELPVSNEADFEYMFASRIHWQPLLNGQSGYFPPWYYDFQRYARQFPNPVSVAFLKSRGVKLVVLHERGYPPEQLNALRTSLERYPNLLRQRQLFPADAVRVLELR